MKEDLKDIILNELSLSESEGRELVGRLPLFPHGKGTDIENGIFEQPSEHELDFIIITTTLDFAIDKKISDRLSADTAVKILEYTLKLDPAEKFATLQRYDAIFEKRLKDKS